MPFLNSIAALSLFAVLPISTAAQSQSNLDTVADALAHKVQLLRKDQLSPLFPRILVADFLDPEGNVSVGGAQLADSLASSLRAKLRPTEVLDRKTLTDYLASTGIAPSIFRERDVACWIAGSVGANLIVRGQLVSSDERTILIVKLVRVSDTRELLAYSSSLSVSQELKQALDEPVRWPAGSQVVVPCTSTTRDMFDGTDVKAPKCIRCPSASFSEEARKAKHSGRVKLAVIVDEKGRVNTATIIRGDEYGLDSQAVSTSKTWQLEPATKNGKPVAVCVPVEVTFQLQ